MTPAEHAAAEMAINAKRAKAAGLHGHGHPPPASSASRIAAIVIWLSAIATLVALFWVNRTG